jgi:uncharacterized membrane protein
MLGLRRVRRLRRTRDERGAVMILGAIFAAVAIFAAALAVDIGRQATAKRDDQRVADMVALDAARGFAIAPSDPRPTITSLAQASAQRNGYDPSDTSAGHSMLIELVKVLPLAGEYTMVTIPPGSSLVDSTANAVRVTLTSSMDNLFGGGTKALKAIAVGALGNGTTCILPCPGNDNLPIGTTRIGSTLASLNTTDTVFLNKLMTKLVGGSVNLDAVGWQGVASGYATFSRLQAALGLTGASPDEVLDTTLTYRELLDATVNALNADGSPSSATAATKVGTIASSVDNSLGLQLTLRKLFSIAGNTGDGSDVANAALSVRDIVVGGAMAADGDHFATVDLGLTDLPVIPNVQSITVRAGLIEAPQTEVGQYGKDSLGNYLTTAVTSQVRLLVDAVLAVPVVDPLLRSILGSSITVRVPYYLEGGSGSASLDTAHCTSTTPDSVDILAVTNAVNANVARVSDSDLSSSLGSTITKGQATVLDVIGVVTVKARTGISDVVAGASQMLNFTPDYAAKQATSQHVTGSALQLPAVAPTDLQVSLLAGGALINVSTLQTTIANGISAAVPGIQNTVLASISKAVGLTFGGADVWAPPVQNCQTTSFTNQPTPTVDSIPTLLK